MPAQASDRNQKTPSRCHDEAVSATNKSLWSLLISHVNIHNAHHGGQIVVIRKLQGSWDAGKGVS